MTFLAEFRRELEREANLERLALLIGGLIEPGIEADYYLDRFDALADQVRERMPASLSGRSRAEALIQTLGHELGFQGNDDEYYEAANSFLHLVVERQVGLPITLSLLYMAIGKRIGMTLEGMGFPGHFMVAYREADETWLLDPFNSTVLEEDGASDYLTGIFSQPIRLQGSLTSYAVSDRMLLLRILNNLRTLYLANHNFADALQVLHLMVLVEPDEPELWRERGLIHFEQGYLMAAETDIRRYFARRDRLYLYTDGPNLELSGLPSFGQVPLLWPGDVDPTEDESDVMTLLHEIRSELDRLN